MNPEHKVAVAVAESLFNIKNSFSKETHAAVADCLKIGIEWFSDSKGKPSASLKVNS